MGLIRYEQKKDHQAITLYEKAMSLAAKIVGGSNSEG
jgi:hypothetical protein